VSTSFHSSHEENTYVLDAQSFAEMTRLRLQDMLVTEHMGGLFSECPDLSSVYDVLDIACGPADWTLNMAYANPHIHVTGVDLSQKMIDHANTRKLPNSTFRVMNVLGPLDFPDNSFDVINARLLFAFMPPKAWPGLMRECFRITRPGGILRLAECESPITNSPASERLNSMSTQALRLVGQSFSPTGLQVGITPMLENFLQDGGYQNTQSKGFAINFSAKTKAHAATYEIIQLGALLVQPFLTKMGVITKEEHSLLYQQSLREVKSDDFRGVWFFLTSWGEKP